MAFFEKIKEFFMRLFTRDIAARVSLKTALSSEMWDALDLWTAMARGDAPWNNDAPSCGLSDEIADALADPVGEEMQFSCDNDDLNGILRRLKCDLHLIVRHIVATGGCVLRPLYSAGRVQYEILPFGEYLPTKYDFDNTLTGCVIVNCFAEGKRNFALCERHDFDGGTHKITNTLYDATNGAMREVSLDACERTAGVEREILWAGVEMPFVVEFRNRDYNRVDGSQCPVSLLAGSESLIKDADEQYSRIVWEQEAGEKKVFADADLFSPRQHQTPDGKSFKADAKLKKLFVRLEGENLAEKIREYSPQLRTVEQAQAFQEILKRIELSCNIGKGTLSDLTDARQTATQFSGGRKAFYSKIDAIEGEIEEKVRRAAYVFAYMLSAAKMTRFAEFPPEVSVSYNDAARKDPDKERETAMREVAQGIMSEAEYRMRFYGETEEEAKSRVPPKPQSAGFVF